MRLLLDALDRADNQRVVTQVGAGRVRYPADSRRRADEDDHLRAHARFRERGDGLEARWKAHAGQVDRVLTRRGQLGGELGIARPEGDLMPQAGEVRRQGSAPASGAEYGVHRRGWGGEDG